MTPQEMRARLAAAESSGEEEQCCGTKSATAKEEDGEFEALDMDEFFEAAELLSNCRDMLKKLINITYFEPRLKADIELLSDEVGQFIEGFVFSSDDEEQTLAMKRGE